MEILSKLFGSQARVKLLRQFIFNPGAVFTSSDLAKRSRLSPASVRRELSLFKAIKLIRPKNEQRGEGKKKKKVSGYQLVPNFTFITELCELMSKELLPESDAIARKFYNCGKIKSIILSGIFVRDPDRSVDIIFVGDNLKRTQIDQTIRTMETEFGRDLTYAILGTSDFLYRLHSSDRFIRDVLDYPHERVLDKLNF